VTSVIAVVLKGYPRLSETFIAHELRALEQAGARLRLFSLRRPTDPSIHPVHREIVAPVVYLPEYLHDEPRRVFRAWHALRYRPGYRSARRIWLKDLHRDPGRNRWRRFGQALVLAHELPADVTWLHAHFLHTPASVTRYASILTGLPWSVSAHAKDVWTIPDWEKREKLADCHWLAACTDVSARHLAALAPCPDRVRRVYHGLDPARFPPPAATRPLKDGSDPRSPVVVLSVGRAVEKKGYTDLLDALARLPTTLNWRFAHIGGGVLLDSLKRQAESLGLLSRVSWHAEQPQERVLAAYRQADLFVLACRIAADGDRDGLPNVLMEAQSQGLACVSTQVSAVPELIIDGETGLLVPPEDAATLSAALERLISDPELRARLGRNGQERVKTSFSFADGVSLLVQQFSNSATPGRARCGSPSTHR
jgi:glycosyltransferase involved in cell wall biosynthesis